MKTTNNMNYEREKRIERKRKVERNRRLKRRKRLFVFLIIVAIAIYIPVKITVINKAAINKEVINQEGANKKIDLVQEYSLLRENYNNLYGDEDVLKNIENSLEYINKNLDNEPTEELENYILDLKLKINSLSSSNELELENEFNNINNLDFSSLSEDEQEKVNNIISEYSNLFKDKKYKLAKEKIEELNTYKEEAKELSNEARIERVYEENSNEDPSLREPKYVNGILVVNKEFGLPSNFAPGESTEARQAFEQMKSDAANEGIYIEAFSTYRSYWSQESLYWSYVNEYGQDPTDTFSARAGFSEHQTGLAFDIGGADKSLWAEEDFKYTEEAKWLKENCTKYGFILRYPEGKEWLTGYMYESWHFRYIGVEHSKNFENNDLTLEEYLGLYEQ